MVVEEVQDVHRLGLAVGTQIIEGEHPVPHHDVLAVGAHLTGQVHLGHQVGDLPSKGVHPIQDVLAAVVVLPQHLPGLPEDHGGHGELGHRIPLGPEEGFPKGGQLLFGVPADPGAVEEGPDHRHKPRRPKDGKDPEVGEEVQGTHRQAADDEGTVDHRAVKIHPIQHTFSSFAS